MFASLDLYHYVKGYILDFISLTHCRNINKNFPWTCRSTREKETYCTPWFYLICTISDTKFYIIKVNVFAKPHLQLLLFTIYPEKYKYFLLSYFYRRDCKHIISLTNETFSLKKNNLNTMTMHNLKEMTTLV